MNLHVPMRLPNDGLIWAGFLALAALSFLNPMAATGALAVACLLAMAKWPDRALGIAAFALGFKQIFALGPSQTKLVMVVVLAGVAAQALWDPRTRGIVARLHRYPLLALLAFSLVLNAAHVVGTPDQENLFRLGWHLLAVLAAIRAAALADNAEAMRSLKYSLVAAGVLIAVISAIYLYTPLPELVGNTFVHTEILRLVGIQDDANSIARWFLPAAIAALLAHDRSSSPWTFAMVVGAAIVLYAAASKSGLIWFGFAWVLVVFFSRRWRAGVTSVLAMVVGAAIWFGAVERPLKRYASEWWYEANLSSDTAVNVAYAIYAKEDSVYKKIGKYADKPFFADLLTSLRIVTTSKTLEVKPTPAPKTAPDGQVAKSQEKPQEKPFDKARDWSRIRDSQAKSVDQANTMGVLESGNRRRLWIAGFEIFRDHFWWGVGAMGWQDEMSSRLGFPYLSPHDGFLHVAGSYGILGALLYLGAMARMAWLVVARRGEAWALCAAACLFAFELFDVSMIFTPTIIGAVVAMLMGAIEGTRLPQGPEGQGQP